MSLWAIGELVHHPHRWSFSIDRHRPRIDLQVDAADLQLARRGGRLYRFAEAAVEQLADRPPLAGLGFLDQLGDDGMEIVPGHGARQSRPPSAHGSCVRIAWSAGVALREASMSVTAVGTVW